MGCTNQHEPLTNQLFILELAIAREWLVVADIEKVLYVPRIQKLAHRKLVNKFKMSRLEME